jgi:hypothetical protein
MAQHALLSASSAKRWIACPPSARIAAEFPDRESEAAQEGTLNTAKYGWIEYDELKKARRAK